MPRFNATNLIRLYNSETSYFQERRTVQLNESQKQTPQFDIFLSHSFLDKQIINGLFVALSKMGYSVYVDWIIDPTLDRSSVNKKTADVIKKRMRQSDTLFHATSVNTKKSNWMPWETGYMDGEKDKCAIVEVEIDDTSKFSSQEYLLLYPYVTEDGTTYSPKIFINNRDSKNKISFDSWKRGLKP